MIFPADAMRYALSAADGDCFHPGSASAPQLSTNGRSTRTARRKIRRAVRCSLGRVGLGPPLLGWLTDRVRRARPAVVAAEAVAAEAAEPLPPAAAAAPRPAAAAAEPRDRPAAGRT